MTTVENRVSVRLQCPNPLFVKWLEEWRDSAKKKNSKTQHTYSLALQSLRKYPLPLEKGRECKILKGFGNKLCEMLEDKLKQHTKENEVQYNIEPEVASTSKTKRNSAKRKAPGNKTSATNNQNEYLPTYKSGSYAILLALYKASITENAVSMSKKDLIRAAQAFCNSSFTKAEPGSYYTAWSSMRTLICKNLVRKYGSPAEYSLTDGGLLIGHKLYTKQNSNVLSPTNSSRNENTNVENTLEQIFLDNKYSQASSDCESQNMRFSDLYEGNLEEKSHFSIPKPTIAASSELIGICGTFSTDKVQNREVLQNEEISKNVGFQDILLSPYSFDVILYIDTQETNGAQVNPLDDPILAELKHLNVNYEVKNLKVGDYCWICRDRISAVELVTPYIIERKRMDDLASSIKDGRFHEQKFRLKQCGLQNVIYMIESYGKKDEHVGLPLNSLYQATVNTLIQDGFCVKFVEGVRGVAEYLSCMSNLIKKNYENKTIASCPRENISNISITDDLVSLMCFTEFNKLSSKSKNFTVRDMFIKQLLQIKGLSIDKALAIVEAYPTPQLLNNIFRENGNKSVNMISNMKYGPLGKKIGPVLSNIIYQLFTKSEFIIK